MVKGYVACPICGGDTCAEYSRYLRKMVYLGSRKFLPNGHQFRRCRAPFNGSAEHGEAPTRRSGTEFMQQAADRTNWLRNGGVENSEGDPVKIHDVKRLSILFALPYWKVCAPAHCLHSRFYDLFMLGRYRGQIW